MTDVMISLIVVTISNIYLYKISILYSLNKYNFYLLFISQ